jgi:hypothetical protein
MKKLFLAIVCAMAITSCEKARTPCVYEVPEGFTGWVLIENNRNDCPPLPTENGKLIFKIGKDGRLCTSSTMEVGWAKDEYYYVGNSRTVIPDTAPGKGGFIWGGANGSVQTAGQKEKTFEIFFVGTEDQFNHAPKQPAPE